MKRQALRSPTLDPKRFHSRSTSGISSPFSELSPTSRQITHVLRTLTPLQLPNIATRQSASDLHVLSTPPAFVLSQNQTLRKQNVSSILSSGRVDLTVCNPKTLQSHSANCVQLKGLQLIAQFSFQRAPGDFARKISPVQRTKNLSADFPFRQLRFSKPFRAKDCFSNADCQHLFLTVSPAIRAIPAFNERGERSKV